MNIHTGDISEAQEVLKKDETAIFIADRLIGGRLRVEYIKDGQRVFDLIKMK